MFCKGAVNQFSAPRAVRGIRGYKRVVAVLEATKVSTDDVISVDGIEIHPHERLVCVGERRVDLTAREFDILMRLAEHPGWVYSSDQLADGEEEQRHEFSADSVRVHIAHLRHKLELAGVEAVVVTVRGVGYRLERGAGGASHVQAGTPADELDRRECGIRLRDCFWLLEQTLLDLERTAGEEQISVACDSLDEARHRIVRLLEGLPDTLGTQESDPGPGR